MKKQFILAIGAILFLLTGCNKHPEIIENEQVKDNLSGRVVTVLAEIADSESKTYYNESTGAFKWTSSDEIALVANESGNLNNQRKAASTSISLSNEDRSATFTASIPDGFIESGIAAYPSSIVKDNDNSSYDALYVKLPYQVSGGINSTVLIGEKDGEIYHFHTAGSVIKVTIKNIPANTSSLRLVTNSNTSFPIDGDFMLERQTVGEVADDIITFRPESYKKYLYYGELKDSAKGYQEVTISTNEVIASRDFYFNVPVGECPANTLSIQLFDTDQNLLMKRTISKAFTTVRGECLSLPELECPAISVYMTGNANNPRVQFDCVVKVFRYNISTTSTNNPSSYYSSHKYTHNTYSRWTTGANIKTEIPALSGKFYFHYLLCSDTNVPTALSDKNVISYGSIPFYFITDADKTAIASQYLRNPAPGTGVTDSNGMPSEDDFNLNGASTLTLAVSNDCTKGNLMITEFLGYNYVIDNSAMPHSSFVDGTPLYGISTGASASFPVVNIPLCTAADGKNYYVSSVTNGNTEIDFTFGTEVSSTTYDLVYGTTSSDTQKWLGLVYDDIWGNGNRFVHYYTSETNKFVADKTSGMIPLTVDMLSAISTLSSGNLEDRKGGLAALIDKSGGSVSWWVDYLASDKPTTDDQGIWIQINLGASKTVNKFTIKFRTTNFSTVAHGIPKEYKIAVSNDGENWEDKTDAIMIESPSMNTWYQQKVNAGNNYQYIRLCITKMNRTEKWDQIITLTGRPISGSGAISEACYATLDEIQIWEN